MIINIRNLCPNADLERLSEIINRAYRNDNWIRLGELVDTGLQTTEAMALILYCNLKFDFMVRCIVIEAETGSEVLRRPIHRGLPSGFTGPKFLYDFEFSVTHECQLVRFPEISELIHETLFQSLASVFLVECDANNPVAVCPATDAGDYELSQNHSYIVFPSGNPNMFTALVQCSHQDIGYCQSLVQEVAENGPEQLIMRKGSLTDSLYIGHLHGWAAFDLYIEKW